VASIRLQNVTKLYRGRAEPTLLFDPPLTVSPALIEAIGARTSPPPGVGEPTVALDDVTLTVDDGRTLAVVGPTGCGKTTLLRVVAGLEIYFTGRVFYDGTDVTNVPVRDRHIGMVFQNYALYPHFEGQGNLAFFFKVRRAPDEETEERIRITSAGQSSFSSTSPSPTWTRSCERGLVRRSSVCSIALPSQLSTSRMTRTRRSPWETRSR
jgi:ABC-type sugar transport system ATPase subunit